MPETSKRKQTMTNLIPFSLEHQPSAPALSAQPGRELPTPKAQTIFVLGVMGYQRHPARPGATFAMLSFDSLLALAKSRGFKGAKQIKDAVRRGRATAFAMDKAQDLAALVTDAELQRELASLSFWDGVRPPGPATMHGKP